MPPTFELDLRADALDTWLRERGWLEAGERVVHVEPAGAGNMNVTVRVETGKRSFVLKQARPFVAKYPHIPAPVERLQSELRFYEVAHRDAWLSARMPRVLAYDRGDGVAMLEDLGRGADSTSIYSGDALTGSDLATLCEFAHRLHALELAEADRSALTNVAMRELDYAHLFVVPLDPDNGLDLDAITPGLTVLARELQRDDAHVARTLGLGELYLRARSPSLLHGDYYPGSFLRSERGLCVIDPEFTFVGPREFDLGVLVAHLVMAGVGPEIAEQIEAIYGAPLDAALLRGFAGVEIVRRLLGVAQLPLPESAGLDRKREWVELARGWLVDS